MKKSNLYFVFLLLWPFIFFFPLSSGYMAMGNDFDLIYYAYKKYIFEFWQDGQLPFWSPSEGAGFTLIYNPFAQFFYIPSWLLFVVADLKNSFSLYDYLIFTIFGISIYSLGQYLWLKNLKISNNKITFIVTLLVPAALILSNFLRFPNAIHTIAWLPFLLLGMNYSLDKSKLLKSFFLIFLSSFFIFTAGYPYFIFYIFVFSCMYFVFILFLFKIDLKKIFLVFLKNLIPVLASLTLAFPWLLGVLKTLSITQDRNLGDYKYASETGFTLIDILGSWIYPVTSNPEGRYYFGIIVTFLICKFLIDLNKKLLQQSVFKKKIIYFTIISFFLISFLSMSETEIFQYFWSNFNLIQNMRAWDRTNILMVPIISLLMVISITYFLEIINKSKLESNSIIYHKISSNFLIIFLLIFQIVLYLNESYSDHWYVWQEKRFIYAENSVPFPLNYIVKLSDGRINILSTFMLLIFINFTFTKLFYYKITNKTKFVLFSILVFVIFEQFLNSNIQWGLKEWKTTNTHQAHYANKTLDDNFNKPRIKTIVHGNNYFRDNAFTINNFLNWGNQKHNSIYWDYFDKEGNLIKQLDKQEIQNVETFFGLNAKNKKIFFSKNLDDENIIKFVTNSEKFEKKNAINYKIKHFSNNKIIIDFYSDAEGYLSYIDNNDFFWHAYLNNRETGILELMNTYKAIFFKSGTNTIEFKYEPFRY